MLAQQRSKGNSGIDRTKYLTISVEADSLKAARPRLERIENDVNKIVKKELTKKIIFV